MNGGIKIGGLPIYSNRINIPHLNMTTPTMQFGVPGQRAPTVPSSMAFRPIQTITIGSLGYTGTPSSLVSSGIMPRGPIPIQPQVPMPSATPKFMGTQAPSLLSVQKGPKLTSLRSSTPVTKKDRDFMIMETMEKQEALPTLTPVRSLITLFSREDMEKLKVVPITSDKLDGPNTVNDPKMGSVSTGATVCAHCGQIDCPGHYGLIRFPEGIKIYNPAYIRETVAVITCVCNNCGHLLITEDVMEQMGFSKMPPSDRLQAMEKYCKKIKKCIAPKVQLGDAPIAPCHENPSFITKEIKKSGVITYTIKDANNKEVTDYIPINSVYSILDSISDHDARLLGFPRTRHPREYPSFYVMMLVNRITPEQMIMYHIHDHIRLNHVKIEVLSILISDLTSAQRAKLGLNPLINPVDMNSDDIIGALRAPLPDTLAAFGIDQVTYDEMEPENHKIVQEEDHRRKVELYRQMGLQSKIHLRDLAPDRITEVLDKLPGKVLATIGFPGDSHPRNMILHGVLVPPVIARPPVQQGGVIHHDQLTIKYRTLAQKVLTPNSTPTSAELYKEVDDIYYATEGKKAGGQPEMPIVARIQGKEAILRNLLMGKRGDYCGRTVAGPDASLKFGQIRIPRVWARVLTKSETVTSFNIIRLQLLADGGQVTYITPKKTGLRRICDTNHRYKLRIGDKVDRWLDNGDRVIINRQPTLHRQSMMAYEVVLGHQLTIGLHLSYTTPMNCDFDGDENNVWNLRDFESEAEAQELMDVRKNIMSSEQNRPIMGLVMNSITAAYLLTDKRTKVNEDLYHELRTLVSNKADLKTLDARLHKYGVHPLSGHGVFSSILPPDFYYNNKGVLIMEGVVVSGQLRKAHVGASHRSIIQDLWKKYGFMRTADFYTDAPWILNKWIIERGFTVGLRDVINFKIDEKTKEEYDENVRVLDRELATTYVKLDALSEHMDVPEEEAYRQRQINNLVDVAKNLGLRLAKDVLKGDNAIGVMTEQGAGTKGGIANIGQMMGSVGQQYYRGERLKPTLTGGRRLLPSYDVDDQSPEAHAFIPQSFFTGLTPEGLFFLQAGGREGLLDTALKTSETGTIQRRLIKAFENTLIAYDGSVRNTAGTMFFPLYNSGYDIGEMLAVETIGKPDFSSFIDLKAAVGELNVARGWVHDQKLKETIMTNRMENITKGVAVPLNFSEKPTISDTAITYDINEEVPIIPQKLKITKFERSRIIGTRAVQLSNNAPPLLPIGRETDPVLIATSEFEAGLIQIYVVRRYPNGSHTIVYPTLENI
jgi:DNA-directed RNA polymerase beta' subunit/DNA-directed RNA polymerase subunit K/omega